VKPLRAVALLSSAAGIAISVYLTIVHFASVPLACPNTSTINCEAVLSSPYGVIAGTGVPTAAAGIVWFAVSALIWTRPPGRLHLIWSSLGLLAVLYLVFIEIVRLGTICLWCTSAHVLVVVLFLVALTTWSARDRVETW
jgi:uncharacterized membrane protein